jgi:hypothetical protein
MSRYTIDLSNDIDSLLDQLAKSKQTTKAEVIRRALASYGYLSKQGGEGRKVSITDDKDKVIKDLILPWLGLGETPLPAQSPPRSGEIIVSRPREENVAAKETVPAEEIFKEAGIEPGKEGVKLTGKELAAFYLAIGVGALIALVTLVMGWDWLRHSPSIPVIPQVLTGNESDLVTLYRSLGEIATTRFTSIFELVVVKALLPVFTTILGFLFGTQTAKSGGEWA